MPDRITLSRAAGYRRPEGTIQVDRATIFGNPWQVGDPGRWWMPAENGKAGWDGEYLMEGKFHQATAVAAFEGWIRRNTLPPMPFVLSPAGQEHMRNVMNARRVAILARLPDLRGHPLGCRCRQGETCHADVLLELANGDTP